MFEVAPNVPFRPQQCPMCRHYVAEINRCRGITGKSTMGLRPLLGQFRGESDKPCPEFAQK